MSIENYNWQAAETDLATVETIEPPTDGKAEATASAVYVDDAAMHATWQAPSDTERRPILPQWATSRSAAAEAAVRLGKLMAYRCGYHGLRLPLYGARLLAWSPVGIARMVGGVWKWASDAEGRQIRSDAVHGKDWQAYSGLVRLRDRHVRFRGSCAPWAWRRRPRGEPSSCWPPPVPLSPQARACSRSLVLRAALRTFRW